MAGRRSPIRSGCAWSRSPSPTRRAATRWRASTGSRPRRSSGTGASCSRGPGSPRRRWSPPATRCTSRRAGGARRRLPRAAREADRAEARRVRARGRGGRGGGPHPPDRPRAALHAPSTERCTRSSRAAAWGGLQIELAEHVAPGTWRTPTCAGSSATAQIAAPILLAKSCHDLDLLAWLAQARRRGSPPSAASGLLPGAAPAGAPERCTDGCPVQASCAHDAVRFYLGPTSARAVWPWSDVSPDPSRDARRRALETGPYGRCVYRCDNDVLDHQVRRGRVRGRHRRHVRRARARRRREPHAAHHRRAGRAARRAPARRDRALAQRLARRASATRSPARARPLRRRRRAARPLRRRGRRGARAGRARLGPRRAREPPARLRGGAGPRAGPRRRLAGFRREIAAAAHAGGPGERPPGARTAGAGRRRRRRARRLRRGPLRPGEAAVPAERSRW